MATLVTLLDLTGYYQTHKGMKRVSIFGCGWVGKALAQKLQPNYQINCSVQSSNSYDALKVKNKFLLTYPNLFDEKFYNVDVLLIAIPPREKYLKTLTKLLSFVLPSTQVILLSSTSIYPQTQGVVTEEMSQESTNPTLMLQAERLVQSLRDDTVILRLGGLMGEKRIAGKYTAGKTKSHDVFVNYIHRDDVVKIIELCIKKELRANVFNAVASQHPKQSELYTQNAKIFGWEETYYDSFELKGKIVSVQKLVEQLDYEFLKPNPLNFWQ